jgi:hypothetical protein
VITPQRFEAENPLSLSPEKRQKAKQKMCRRGGRQERGGESQYAVLRAALAIRRQSMRHEKGP